MGNAKEANLTACASKGVTAKGRGPQGIKTTLAVPRIRTILGGRGGLNGTRGCKLITSRDFLKEKGERRGEVKK